METISYTMVVPKELKEVIDFLEEILTKIMKGESITTYMELIDDLYAAIEGVQDIKEEIGSEYRDEAAGYLVHKILGALLPVEEPE